jgi:WD40 repeat protein/tRNA A-37 threonylcarbamoyl transferase component Bud32
MTPSYPSDSSQQGLLEEVLEDYMQRLDRGEVVDREQFLAKHPELSDELRSYFAGTDEVERLARPARRESPALSHSPTLPETPSLEGTPSAHGAVRRVGDYELLEQIGQGGMGVIYKARQLSLSRLVAVKMIRPDRLATAADVLRFRSEAEAAADLDHPNIAPIYEVGEHEREHYFSMKLLGGGSLAEHLPRLRSDLRAAVGLMATVARAVHHAHQRGLLHRDLKPANILLDEQGRPYVTDFGLAKRLGPKPSEMSLTQQGMIVGTPSYMAPEQADAAGGVSTAADVYSLGAILYELLTGRPPFRADTPLETLVQLREREPASPRRLNRRVNRDLETVCLKCLNKQPQQRYPSAVALADDLERWLTGESIQARPAGRCERAFKWARRRPALAVLIGLLGFVFFAGFAGVSWQWRRAEGAYRKATKLAGAEQQTAHAHAIPLAYAEWRAGNAGRAQQMLDECHPELCGWEWHYLQRLFRFRQLATLEDHAGEVLAVAFNPDGSRFASAGAEEDVKVWDRQSLREVFTLRGHTAPITAVVFSPDGHRLASGGADGIVRVWDAASGEIVVNWQAHAAVTGLAFDPVGQRLASTGRGELPGGELKLWDATTGKALRGKTWQNLLTAVVFSSDGLGLVTPSHDGDVLLWDAANLDASPHLFKMHTEQTVLPWTSVAISADGQWVAAGSSGGVVRVWGVNESAVQGSWPAQLAPAGRRVRVWGVNESAVQEYLTPSQAGVSGLAFAGRDGRILVAATADNQVQAWFTRSGLPAFALRGHRRAVTAVTCSPDGLCLVSASRDRTVKLWDIRRHDDVMTLRPTNQGVTSVGFSPDGAWLASATRDKALKVSNLATRKTVRTVRHLPGVVNSLSFRPGGKDSVTPTLLASAGGDGAVRVWEMPAGQEKLCLRGHDGAVHAVAFRPDGDCLASAGDDGTIRVWEVTSGREKLCLRDHGGPVRALAFSPDGRRLASAGDDGIVRVWDGTTGQELFTLGDQNGPVYAVAFSLDGRSLAAAGRDESIRVWDASVGNLLQTLQGHAGTVRALAYGPRGRLASAGDDMAVRLWDSTGHELLVLRGHKDAVRALSFCPEGHRLASASEDRTIKIWDGTPLEEAMVSEK